MERDVVPALTGDIHPQGRCRHRGRLRLDRRRLACGAGVGHDTQLGGVRSGRVHGTELGGGVLGRRALGPPQPLHRPGVGQNGHDVVAHQRGERAQVLDVGWIGEGHHQLVALELEADGAELAHDRHRGDLHGVRGRTVGVQVDHGHLGQLRLHAEHHVRRCRPARDEQAGEGTAARDRLVDQRAHDLLGGEAAVDQGVGQTPGRLASGSGGGGHATTRSTSSRVVSPSSALRRPL